MHWVVSRKPISGRLRFIAAFDLATEEYREAQVPDFEDDTFIMKLSSLGGSLCVACNFPNSNPPMALADHESWSAVKRVEVWVMKEYGVKESWTKLLSIVPTDKIGPFSYILPVAYFSACGDGRVLLDQSGQK